MIEKFQNEFPLLNFYNYPNFFLPPSLEQNFIYTTNFLKLILIFWELGPIYRNVIFCLYANPVKFKRCYLFTSVAYFILSTPKLSYHIKFLTIIIISLSIWSSYNTIVYYIDYVNRWMINNAIAVSNIVF